MDDAERDALLVGGLVRAVQAARDLHGHRHGQLHGNATALAEDGDGLCE